MHSPINSVYLLTTTDHKHPSFREGRTRIVATYATKASANLAAQRHQDFLPKECWLLNDQCTVTDEGTFTGTLHFYPTSSTQRSSFDVKVEEVSMMPGVGLDFYGVLSENEVPFGYHDHLVVSAEEGRVAAELEAFMANPGLVDDREGH